MKQLWEILVPTIDNDGEPFRTRYHRVWDAKVREISGGLTIMPVAKGQWINPEDNKLFAERMIPVRMLCTRAEMEQIVDMTIVYYRQEAVLAYVVSNEVILKNKTAPHAPLSEEDQLRRELRLTYRTAYREGTSIETLRTELDEFRRNPLNPDRW